MNSLAYMVTRLRGIRFESRPMASSIVTEVFHAFFRQSFKGKATGLLWNRPQSLPS